MYKYIQLFLLTALFSMSALSTNLPDKLLNSPLHLISGETITLAQHRGNRPVYLKFWATWCQPCRKEMPHFEHIQKQYGDSIEIIGFTCLFLTARPGLLLRLYILTVVSLVTLGVMFPLVLWTLVWCMLNMHLKLSWSWSTHSNLEVQAVPCMELLP